MRVPFPLSELSVSSDSEEDTPDAVSDTEGFYASEEFGIPKPFNQEQLNEAKFLDQD